MALIKLSANLKNRIKHFVERSGRAFIRTYFSGVSALNLVFNISLHSLLTHLNVGSCPNNEN